MPAGPAVPDDWPPAPSGSCAAVGTPPPAPDSVDASPPALLLGGPGVRSPRFAPPRRPHSAHSAPLRAALPAGAGHHSPPADGPGSSAAAEPSARPAALPTAGPGPGHPSTRSEEHTSELQSRGHL